MVRGWWIVSGLALALPGILSAQQIEQSKQVWASAVVREFGQPVIPIFDGWFANSDGSKTLCYGYFNLNTAQTLDIPHGEANYLSDERYRFATPTHFDPRPPQYRRKFCVFTIDVPADFPANQTIDWHLTSAGEALSVPGHVLPAYVLDEPDSIGRGRKAPTLSMPGTTGKTRGRRGITFEPVLRVTAGEALEIPYEVEHDNTSVWVGWTQFSGPGQVSFSVGEATVTADGSPQQVSVVFSEPGDYVVQLQSISSTADFEFFCCHSNAYYKVTVR